MPRYKLKDNCLFVDAKDLTTNIRYPEAIPFPHVLDKNTQTYKKFNDTAGFIARFVVIGVDTGLIPQIVLSEYGTRHRSMIGGKPNLSEASAKAAVSAVVKMLMPYLERRKPTDYHPPYEPPQDLGVASHENGYKLDFSVNFMGTTCCKIPPLPKF